MEVTSSTGLLKEWQELKSGDDKTVSEELDLAQWQYRSVVLRHEKIKFHLEEGFEIFSDMVMALIKTGVMNRLFAGHNNFEFFSPFDRDSMSPRSQHIKKNKEKPIKCGKRVDAFGDVKWDFAFARDEDDSSSSSSGSMNSDSDRSDSSGKFSFSGADPGFIG